MTLGEIRKDLTAIDQDTLKELQDLVSEVEDINGPRPWVTEDRNVKLVDWYKTQDRDKLATHLGIGPNYLSNIIHGNVKPSGRIVSALAGMVRRSTGCAIVTFPDY
jgi:hypothetical protein